MESNSRSQTEVVHQKDTNQHHHPHANHPHPVKLTSGVSGQISLTDPENPQNWPSFKKVYVSTVAAAFAFTV